MAVRNFCRVQTAVPGTWYAAGRTIRRAGVADLLIGRGVPSQKTPDRLSAEGRGSANPLPPQSRGSRKQTGTPRPIPVRVARTVQDILLTPIVIPLKLSHCPLSLPGRFESNVRRNNSNEIAEDTEWRVCCHLPVVILCRFTRNGHLLLQVAPRVYRDSKRFGE